MPLNVFAASPPPPPKICLIHPAKKFWDFSCGLLVLKMKYLQTPSTPLTSFNNHIRKEGELNTHFQKSGYEKDWSCTQISRRLVKGGSEITRIFLQVWLREGVEWHAALQKTGQGRDWSCTQLSNWQTFSMGAI